MTDEAVTRFDTIQRGVLSAFLAAIERAEPPIENVIEVSAYYDAEGARRGRYRWVAVVEFEQSGQVQRWSTSTEVPHRRLLGVREQDAVRFADRLRESLVALFKEKVQ